MKKWFLIVFLLGGGVQWGNAQIFSEDFGTTFSTTYLGAPNWSSCRTVSGNSSSGPCAGFPDYNVYIYNNDYITTEAISIPGTGYCLNFDYSFNAASGFPQVQIGTGGAFCFSAGTVYTTVQTLTQTATCDPVSISLDAYAGQTIYIRFQSGATFTSWYIDDVIVDNSGCSGGGGGGTTCLLDDDFGTAFASISTTNWPTACRSGSPSSFNTSGGSCSGGSDYSYGLTGFRYITSMGLAIPATGYTLDFSYAFNYTFGFPQIEIRGGGTCGTTLLQTVNLTNTGGVCTPQSVNLDAYSGQTIFIRLRSNTSSATVYYDDIQVCGPAVAPSPKYKWADNFNDNDLILDYTGTDGDEDCATCGPWVLGAGASLNLVPAGGWNGNTNETEAFIDNMPNVYYVRLDRNEYIESPVLDLSNFESFKISFYAKSSSPGTGGGDQWSFSDRLRLQIWDGSAWQTVQSMRDDLVGSWSGPDDFISAALPFNYYCFSAYKSTSSPGNYYYNSSPNVDPSWFHSGFKFRVIFEGGFSGSPFAWVDDFTFRADADGYSTMIPCGISFWNEPTATSYGMDPGTTGNNNAEKGVELELDNSINIPPNWLVEADDGDTVTQIFGAGESERVVFCVLSEQEINFAFPKVHFYAPDIGWQSTVMSIDNNYTGPGWKYYAVEYISCDLAGGSIAAPTTDFQYYFSFEYGIEFMPVFYQLNTSGIEYGGGVTSAFETFNAPDVVDATGCGPLPIQWLSVTGKWEEGVPVIGWSVANENNTRGYAILRSTDGQQFSEIDFLPKAERPHGKMNYFLTDDNYRGNHPVVYYQIRHEDLDGQFDLSEVVALNRYSQTGFTGQLAPNPSNYSTQLSFQGAEPGNISVEILDGTGRLVRKTDREISGSSGNLTISAENLEKGLYFVKMGNAGQSLTMKWLVMAP